MDTTADEKAAAKQDRIVQQELARQQKAEKKAERHRQHLENQQKAQEAKALRLKQKNESKTQQDVDDATMQPTATATTPTATATPAVTDEEREKRKAEKLERKQENIRINEESRLAKLQLKEAKKAKALAQQAENERKRTERELREVVIRIDQEEVKKAIIEGLRASDCIESFVQAGQSGQWKIKLKTLEDAAKLRALTNFNISSTATIEAAPVTAHSVYFRCPDNLARETRLERDVIIEQSKQMLNETKVNLGDFSVAWKGNVIIITFDDEAKANNIVEQHATLSLQDSPVSLLKGRPSDSFVRGSRKRQRQESAN